MVLKAAPDGDAQALVWAAESKTDHMEDGSLELGALRVGEPGAMPLPPQQEAKFN
jgi:hypothetical protein